MPFFQKTKGMPLIDVGRTQRHAMSILHSFRAPWLMLILFGIAALAFFILAVWRDVVPRPETVTGQKQTTVLSELRRDITWNEQKIVDAENANGNKTDKTLESAGQTLEDWAGGDEEDEASPETSDPNQPLPAGPDKPDKDAPGKVLSHEFTLIDAGFQASFATDRPVLQPRIFFIADPARWVLDVPGTWENTARFSNVIADGFIARVVLGEHAGYLRIVFHFRDVTRLQPDESPRITLEEKGFLVLVPGPA
jgi:hypothetical protein